MPFSVSIASSYSIGLRFGRLDLAAELLRFDWNVKSKSMWSARSRNYTILVINVWGCGCVGGMRCCVMMMGCVYGSQEEISASFPILVLGTHLSSADCDGWFDRLGSTLTWFLTRIENLLFCKNIFLHLLDDLSALLFPVPLILGDSWLENVVEIYLFWIWIKMHFVLN